MAEVYRLNLILRQPQWDIFYGTGHTYGVSNTLQASPEIAR